MRMIRMGFVALVVAFATSEVHSDFADIRWEWYSEASFTYVCGYESKDCSGNIASGGVTSNWKARIITSCSSGNQNVRCWSWSGSSWQEVPCYLQDGRIRIPVG